VLPAAVINQRKRIIYLVKDHPSTQSIAMTAAFLMTDNQHLKKITMRMTIRIERHVLILMLEMMTRLDSRQAI
jgi:hypothetical protein